MKEKKSGRKHKANEKKIGNCKKKEGEKRDNKHLGEKREGHSSNFIGGKSGGEITTYGKFY